MVARVLFPWLTARIRSLFGRFVQPPPVTQLHLERREGDPGPDSGHLGFTLEENGGHGRTTTTRHRLEKVLTAGFGHKDMVRPV